MRTRFALACLVAGACAHANESAPVVDPANTAHVERVARTQLPSDSPQFHGLMSEHFGFTAAARNAMVRGDLPAVRNALNQLADYPYTESVPGAWLPRVVALQRDARAIAASDGVEALAEGVANLAHACGDCHRATGGGIAASVVARDPTNGPDTLPDRMFRHERAAEQMWLGLVAPSSEAWNQGASRLANASIEVEVHGKPPASFARGLHYVRFLGATAERANTGADRARVYGNLLIACAECHRAPIGPVY